MLRFEQGWPESYHEKIKHIVKTQSDADKYIKVGKNKVFDTELIFSRVIGLQASSREVDVKQLLTYELAPVSTSMFDEYGDMRICKAKSVMKNTLKKELSVRSTMKDIATVIIDGSAILYCIRWPSGGTVGDYIVEFRKYVQRKLAQSDVFLVFDRYRDYSIKDAARAERSITKPCLIHSLSAAMLIPSQKNLLSIPRNKKQLIALIVEDLQANVSFPISSSPLSRLVITGNDDIPIEITRHVQIQRQDMKTTHEEADNILAQQMVYVAKESMKGLSVISDDTDVFLLLLFHYLKEGLNCQVIMESPVQQRAAIDVTETVKCHKAILPDILAAHALSGCDTTACFYGIGKATVLKVLRSGKASIHSLGDPDQDFRTVLHQATKFIAACYGVTSLSDKSNMSTVRQCVWGSKVGKAPSVAPKLRALPPAEAFEENVKRAHFQACVWKCAIDADPPDMDPTCSGWERKTETRSLTPVMFKEGIQLAPSEVLQLIKCSCESQTSCNTLRCRCKSSRLPCTMFCACQGSDVCNNEQKNHV